MMVMAPPPYPTFGTVVVRNVIGKEEDQPKFH